MVINKNLKEPFVVLNFKAYETGTGKNALSLAKRLTKLPKAKIAIAVQPTDIQSCAKAGMNVFAQHIDPVGFGKFTGFITAAAVKEAGAIGTLLNHAEHKIPVQQIALSVEAALAQGLITICCAANVEEAVVIAKIATPDYIALEIPELISGNLSISKANPDMIRKTIDSVQKIKPIPIICGAGVSGKDDVKTAIKLGTIGVLVANFVMNAKDPVLAAKELVDGLK